MKRLNTYIHCVTCVKELNNFFRILFHFFGGGGWADAHRGRRRTLDTLELESQVVISHPGWVLGCKLRSSVRAVHALNH